MGLHVSATFADSEFNTAFLNDNNSNKASVEAVEKGYSILPGTYQFSVYLNKEYVDTRTITFYKTNKQVQPCIDESFLTDYGILIDHSKRPAELNKVECLDLTALIPNAVMSFDAGIQRLEISIPQVNLQYRPKGYIPTKLYNEGIPAALLNYNISSNYIKNSQSRNYSTVNMMLNGGLNLGAWRYRNQSIFTFQSQQKNKWQNISNQIERNIVSWRARLLLGDASTGSELFDSFTFRGIQLTSDDLQLSYSLKSYAPIVRGVAASNATVEIRQNNFLIYSTNVAPGAFEIKDIVAASDSGNLNVKVIESNGTVQNFIQPYSAIPNMLRQGQWRYGITSGRYRSGSQIEYAPYFGQFSLSYGLNNKFTPYGGALIAQDYISMGLGLGFSLGRIGAASTDIIYAQNTLSSGVRSNGASLRFLYFKSLNQIGTNVRVMGYRYSTKGYYSLSDAVSEKSQWLNAYNPQNGDRDLNTGRVQINNTELLDSAVAYNKKNQLQLSLSQNLGPYGQVYGNWSTTDYWNTHLNQQSWQFGYNTFFHNLSVNVFYQNTKSFLVKSDYTIGINITLPLGRMSQASGHDTTSTSSYQYSGNQTSTVQTGISRSFLKDRNLQVQAQAGYSDSSTFSVNSSYQGTRGDIDFGYSQGENYNQLSSNLRGGILLHSGGIVIGQQLANNPILIEAKGATGIRVENQPGLSIDRQGYAIIRSSNPYYRNRVALRAEDIGANLNINQFVEQDIVPTRGAVVKVVFDVTEGRSVLAHVVNVENQPIQLGSTIYLNQKSVGIFGTDGNAYMTGVKSGETMVVEWGSDVNEKCTFVLPKLDEKSIGYSEISAQCK